MDNLSTHLRRIPTPVLILISGLLTILAFPPLPTGFLAYFALVPLIYVFWRADFHLGFEKGYCYGIILNLGILYWLALNKGTTWYYATLSMIAAVLFVALNYGAIGLLWGYIGRAAGKNLALVALPFVWVAVEFLRTFGTLGFTWNNLAYTQSQAVQLIQMAAIIGPTGLSLWVVTLNVLNFALIRRLIHRESVLQLVLIIGTLFLIPTIYGGIVLTRSNPDRERCPVTVGLIQPNVDPNEKWDRDSFRLNMQMLHDLTDSVAQQPCDLIVWPESATPTFLRRNHFYSLTNIFEHLDRLQTNLLTGAPDYEYQPNGVTKIYNSTFLLQANSREILDYRKMRLVPFGEYIPLSGYFPELKQLNLGQGNFDAGEEMRVYTIPLKCHRGKTDSLLALHSVVCYESTFPEIVRLGALKGSELLVIVSNDAWFGPTSAPYLHAEISRFRAIENRLPVVRAANTGVSLFLDEYGRELARLSFGEQGYLTATLQQGKPATIFVRWGNWVGKLSVIVAFAGLLYSFITRKKCAR
jgi:apolipoprotein N-acyltransferase